MATRKVPCYVAVLILGLSCKCTIASSTAANESANESTNKSAQCETEMSVEIPKAVVLGNGSAWDPDGQFTYPPGTHWRAQENGSHVHRGCPCNVGGRPCIRKCCPIGQSATMEIKCGSPGNPFAFNVTDEEGSESFEVVGNEHFAILYGNPCKSGRYLLEPDLYDTDVFWIRSSDGALVVPEANMTEYGPKDFCLEYFPEKMAHHPALCVPPDAQDVDDDSESLVYIIYPIFMIISSLFLLVTFLVYALLPELRNLHGKCLTNHVGTLLATYTFLVVVQLGGRNISQGLCVTSAFIIEFAFLGTFFWLNAMCFDICITFCGMRPLPGSLKERENKKFIFYSLYAWGCPSIILIISLIMDFTPGIPDHYIKPRFGRTRCWFDRKMDAFAFFFGPVAMLITSNIIMFIITAVKIVQLNRQTDMVKKAGGSCDDNENRNRFNLYLKLLIVMGVNWIMELISWAVGGPDYLWYVTDIGNTLQGVFIFVIFVWKDKIRSIVIQKLCPKMAAKRSTTGSSSGKWRTARGSSPNKSSTSGGTASSGMTSQTGDNVKLKPIDESYSTKDHEYDSMLP